MIVKSRGKYLVKSKAGKVLGTHQSREAAAQQLRAIEASKHGRAKAKRAHAKVK